jgi:hypothetical protein
MITEQEAAPEEIEALKQFLTRDGTCLMIGPHHDVGASQDVKRLQMEYAHHGDPWSLASSVSACTPDLS